MIGFTKWLLFSFAWMIALSFFWPQSAWLCAASGGLIGFISLVFFDTWRGRREEREMRRQFEAAQQGDKS
jgi:uncharacterized membrane protein